MEDLENKLDQAIQKLRQGASRQEVLSALLGEAQELGSLLNLAESLVQIPKNQVPMPLKKRKFAMSPVKSFWLGWFRVSRFASVSMALMLLVAAGAGTGYVAASSLPGQPLFSLKKYEENLALKFAQTPKARASLQLQIAQKRLLDAQKVFSDSQSSTQQQTAAITALVTETNNSIAAVDTAAKSNALGQPDHPILKSLQDVTQQQQTLLSEAKSAAGATANAQSALEATQDNVKKVAAIKKYVIAAAEEQTLINLAANPNTVTISGELTRVAKDKVLVEQTAFFFDDQTKIKDDNGKVLNASDLKNNMQVSVIADKTSDHLLAKIVTVMTADGIVKSATTTTSTPPTLQNGKPGNPSSTPPSSAAKTENNLLIKKVVPNFEADSTPDNGTLKPNNTAAGSFIMEDPAPQAALK